MYTFICVQRDMYLFNKFAYKNLELSLSKTTTRKRQQVSNFLSLTFVPVYSLCTHKHKIAASGLSLFEEI